MLSIENFNNAELLTKTFEGEVFPSEQHSCFPGAWYYKAVSARNHWLGIEAVITLPVWIPDETRSETVEIQGKPCFRHLDTPSVYVGGSSDFETDIGFGFFHGKFDGVITDGKVSFRPFWRTIWMEDGIQKNVYSGVQIDHSEHYFYPGDKVFLQLVCLEENYLTLIIKLLVPTSIEPYATYRNKGNLPQDLIVERIKAPGNGIRNTEYKRVNAIDQYHNEGKPTQDTLAQSKLGTWEHVFLFKEIDGKLMKVPFTEQRFTRMACPIKEAFTVTKTINGESITIDPSNVRR